MTKSELAKLKAAVKSMRTENDTFSIKGKDFSCRWNGVDFIWTPPSGDSATASTKQVIKWIGNGSFIVDYCFSYGE